MMAILATLTLLAGCSPDIEEEESATIVEVTEEETAETPLIPEPDWADSVMTITVGRFETRQQMFDKMKESFQIRRFAEKDIIDKRRTLTPPDQQYTVDIAVLTMKEVGIHNPTNITRITKHFRELGYRPLTPEEAMELRLHLPDQPDSSTRHKMSSFFVLSGEEAALLNPSGRKATYLISCIALEDADGTALENGAGWLKEKIGFKVVKAFGWWLHEDSEREFIIDPNDTEPFSLIMLASNAIRANLVQDGIFRVDFGGTKEGYPTTRFAAAVINSEKRQ